MIVITRNGKTTVVTGWRAWLIGAAAVVVTSVIVALVVFLAFGIALTLTMVLAIVVPIAIGVALIASLFRPAGVRRGRAGPSMRPHTVRDQRAS